MVLNRGFECSCRGLLFVDHTEELVESQTVNVQYARQRFQGDICLASFDPPVLDLRQVVFLRKGFDCGITLLYAQVGQLISYMGQNVLKGFICSHSNRDDGIIMRL